MNPLDFFFFFFGGGAGVVAMMSPQGGTHLEWGMEGRGMKALSQILSDVSLSYSLTSSNGNMFRVTGFCAGNSPVTAGNSPVTGEFPSHRQWRGALMFSLICACTNGWVNNRDVVDLRRHRTHYDVTVMNTTRLKTDSVRLGTVWLGISVRKSPLFASFWFCTRNFRTDFIIHMQNHIPW